MRFVLRLAALVKDSGETDGEVGGFFEEGIPGNGEEVDARGTFMLDASPAEFCGVVRAFIE